MDAIMLVVLVATFETALVVGFWLRFSKAAS